MKILPDKPKRKLFLINYEREETFLEQQMREKANGWNILSSTVFPLEHVDIKLETEVDPRYSFNDNKLYLPYSYLGAVSKKDSIYYTSQEKLGNFYEDFIAYHEIGHAVQHHLVKNGQTVHTKESPSLSYLFNGASVPNKINNFLKEIFKESYADCYAALCLYKKTKNLSVFDNVSDIRETRYIDMKKQYGNHYIHPNFNYTSPKILGDLVKNHEAAHGNIFKLDFCSDSSQSIEKMIEHSVLKGCINTVCQEISSNDSFVNQLIKNSKEFKPKSNNQQVSKLFSSLNQNSIVPFFTEFSYRCDNQKIISDTDIINIINNKDYNRIVNPDLELMNVANIPYSAGLEKSDVKQRAKKMQQKYLNIGDDVKNTPLKPSNML